MDLPWDYISKLLAVFYTEYAVIQGRQHQKKPSLVATRNDVETGAAHQGYFKSSNRPSNFSMCSAKLPSTHQYTCYLAGFVLGRTKLVCAYAGRSPANLRFQRFLQMSPSEDYLAEAYPSLANSLTPRTSTRP